MFTSLLIANRGEIARRIMRTARAMGLRTIAVYSEADREAAFVREADVAVAIGGAAAADSYLRVDRILAAAAEAGADAIHPGYGFLSENAAFAEAVARAKIAWIGPPADSIRAMGLKDAAKSLMERHGVPITPGYHGSDQSAQTLKAAARQIGYPVLIKAIAGGGGRGMRRVNAASDFEAGLASAQREAMASFGDDRVLVEKFVESPRHIEVQIFADNFGDVIHLFERDCSLQRRRQKVIEEAPAPGMTAPVRAAMTEAAIMAAKAVGYRNAGTVEFIVDGAGALRPDGFWFMEMNTRLQVEHPVTEMITGLDLVELQLRVAAGERLPTQASVGLTGWAVEARLCAEDPARNFLPSSGRLEVFRTPAFARSVAGGLSLRLDSAVEAGDGVPAAYDSMIAKAIAHAPTREGAMAGLAAALRTLEVWPVVANAALLANLLDDPEVRAGRATTQLVEAGLAALASRSKEERNDALILGALALEALADDPRDPWGRADGFRLNAPASAVFAFELDGEGLAVRLETSAGGARSAVIGDERLSFETSVVRQTGAVAVRVMTEGRTSRGAVRVCDSGPVLFFNGRAVLLRPPEFSHVLDALAGGDDVRAPMPGKILDVKAGEGDVVKRGAPLIVLEAMKMEHTLTAPRDGRIALVGVRAGEQTAEGAILVKLEPVEKDKSTS